MDTALLNRELTLAYPGGFTVLDGEMLRQMYRDDPADRWGIRDEEAQTIVFLHGSTCYTVYGYTRPECAAENRKVFEEILGSMVFA